MSGSWGCGVSPRCAVGSLGGRDRTRCLGWWYAPLRAHDGMQVCEAVLIFTPSRVPPAQTGPRCRAVQRPFCCAARHRRRCTPEQRRDARGAHAAQEAAEVACLGLVFYIAVASFSPTAAPGALSDGMPLDGCSRLDPTRVTEGSTGRGPSRQVPAERGPTPGFGRRRPVAKTPD